MAAAAALSKIGIAFLEMREPRPDGTFGKPSTPPVAPAIRKVFSGPLVLNSDYDGARAVAAMETGVPDAIAFGRPFLANPDLPARLAEGVALTKDVPKTWYSQGAEGYVDYPRMGEAKAVAAQ